MDNDQILALTIVLVIAVALVVFTKKKTNFTCKNSIAAFFGGLVIAALGAALSSAWMGSVHEKYK